MGREPGPSVKLGVTGGIGSGKSTVCKVFSVLGIPVFSADAEAGEIMNSDREIIEKVNEAVGKDLYQGGTLNKEELASLMFNNSILLSKINSIVHPAVFRRFNVWTGTQQAHYVIMEAAILFESGASKLVDRVATVVAPEEERISRVMERNRLSRKMVMERITNQMGDEERIKLSDYVISNSENDMIIPVILGIHEDMLTLVKNSRS